VGSYPAACASWKSVTPLPTPPKVFVGSGPVAGRPGARTRARELVDPSNEGHHYLTNVAPISSRLVPLPGRPSSSAERRIRVVVLFPDVAEIRDLDEVPPLGTRLRSVSGYEWFVAEVLPSGRDTYTVRCVGRREFLDEFATRSDRARLAAGDLLEDIGKGSARTRERATDLFDDVADELLQRVRRSIRDQAWHQAETAFVASYVSTDGSLFGDVIRAKSFAAAQSQALERARRWNMTVEDVRPGPEWLNARYGSVRTRGRWRRVARFLPRVR
jgi:hypothetical protein